MHDYGLEVPGPYPLPERPDELDEHLGRLRHPEVRPRREVEVTKHPRLVILEQNRGNQEKENYGKWIFEYIGMNLLEFDGIPETGHSDTENKDLVIEEMSSLART